MLLLRFNRVLSKGLVLNGGWSSAKQRLSLPIRRLFSENGKKNDIIFSSGIRRFRRSTFRLPFPGSGSNERLPLKDFVSKNGKTLISVTLALAVAYGLYCYKRIWIFEKHLSSTTVDSEWWFSVANDDYIDRLKEKARIRQLIMSPLSSTLPKFHVYIGPHRAGKSRAVTEVVEELRKEGVKGVHYITADQPLYKCLLKAFSMGYRSVMNGFWDELFTRDHTPVFPENQAPEISFSQVANRLAKSAKKYENGRLTTIIVDGVNLLVPIRPSDRRGPEELHKLIEIAKEHADKHKIHWILVDSSGVALDVMYSASGSSRLKLVFSRDVSEEEAKEFLKKRFEEAGKKIDADQVYECVTGGRIGLLRTAADAVKEEPSTSLEENGGGLKAALKRLFGIAALPAREGAATDVDVAETVTTFNELFESVYPEFKRDLKKVFSTWPFIEKSEPTEEFQYRILRLLAENPKGFKEDTDLRSQAGQDYFKAKGINCDAAIRQLLKSDLLRYVSLNEVALHSNAIKYIVLNKGQPLKSGGRGDYEKK